MRRLLDTEIAAKAMAVLFALAATWNAGIAFVPAPYSPLMLGGDRSLTVAAPQTNHRAEPRALASGGSRFVGHGPTIPPDPWEEVRLA